MKRVKILKNNVVSHSAEMVDPAAWIAEQVTQNSWGKPDRWVREMSGEDITQAIETRQVEKEPGVFVTEYKLPAEYTIQIEDITAEVTAREARETARLAAQSRIDLLDVQARLQNATTVAGLRSAVQEILADLVALRKR